MLLRPISLSLALLLTTAPVFAQIAPTPPGFPRRAGMARKRPLR